MHITHCTSSCESRVTSHGATGACARGTSFHPPAVIFSNSFGFGAGAYVDTSASTARVSVSVENFGAFNDGKDQFPNFIGMSASEYNKSLDTVKPNPGAKYKSVVDKKGT